MPGGHHALICVKHSQKRVVSHTSTAGAALVDAWLIDLCLTMYVVEYTGIPLFPLAKWYSSLETASQYSYPSSAINDGTTYRTALTQLLLFRNLGPTSKYDTTSQYGQSEACSRHMQRLRVPRPSAAATHPVPITRSMHY